MQVPPGVGAGQPVKFVVEGQSFAAAVPEGYTPGMTFQATGTAVMMTTRGPQGGYG